MIEFEFNKKDLDKINNTLKSLSSKEANGVMTKFMEKLVFETEKTMHDNILSGQVLRIRTGRLNSSVGSYVYQEDGLPVALVGSGVEGARRGGRLPYASIHETGGVITPKKAKFLTIPLKAALTDSGSQLRGGALKAKDFPDTFIMRGDSGGLFIMQRRKKRPPVALFRLVKSVTIPARHYMSKTIDLVRPKVEGLFDLAMKQYWGTK